MAMTTSVLKSTLLKTVLSACVLILASGAALAQSSVTLTAKPTTTTLPDGKTVPMWGYTCGAVSTGVSCTALNGQPQSGGGWQPPLIVVPAGTLAINLVNNLTFGSAAIPTSLVIDGQLGGGLGVEPQRVPSPTHAPQGTTWPGTPGGTGPGDTVFTPPAQADRVRSFGTEVAAGASRRLCWGTDCPTPGPKAALRPGTYIIHSGTQPSIQHAMGLYGVLVVTEVDATTNTPTPKTAYGQTFDKDVALLFSEIDPAQNSSVDQAVRTAGFNPAAVWNGQTGECGDPAVHTCYPPAVNYSPAYFLINGVSFDRTAVAASSLSILPPATPGTPVPAATGRLLLRLANAGQRMHVPALVGLDMTLLAEDGNKLPGLARVQSSVFLAAGKTQDATISPGQSAGNFVAASYAVFDRSLALSTNNQSDGGMQAYLAVAGGSSTGVGSQSGSGVNLTASSKSYACFNGVVLSVSDPQRGLLGGTTGANGVVLGGTFTGAVSTSNLQLLDNGTFTYTPPSSGSCTGTFTFVVNGQTASPYAATITQCTSSACGLGGAPTAVGDTYTSKIAHRFQISRPGVLVNDTDPSGLPLHAALAGVGSCATVVLNPDGSFIATRTGAGAGACSFTYSAVNSQNTPSASTATVTVSFGAPSNLAVTLRDSKSDTVVAGPGTGDYRWIIEEDRTPWVDPNVVTSSVTAPVRNPALDFHTSHMPVVAQGCTGPVSCESGQTVFDPATGTNVPAVCDVGNGACRPGTQKTAVYPGDVSLDFTNGKRYYISILPADSLNPLVNAPPDDVGHAMGGAQIANGQTAVTVYMMPTPFQPAQISVYVFQDDNPLNGQEDTGGGVDVLAPNEPGLGGFNLVLLDQAGLRGDSVGQITYNMQGQPVTNALAGRIDPVTGNNACAITNQADNPNLVGVIVTCPKYEVTTGGAVTNVLSPLAGHALIMDMYPGFYEVQASPGAGRISRGEEWLQTNTLDGSKPIEAFIMPNEPTYFQEFGPGGYHVAIGFANPAVIKARKPSICAPTPTNANPCPGSFYGQVSTTRLSRTPDQRIYGSGTYDSNSYTQCYVGLGYPDRADFDFAKCDENGHFEFTGIPPGDFKIAVFDQYNDLLLDGLVIPVHVGGTGPGSSPTNRLEVPVLQWRTNLYGRVFLDQNGDGVSQDSEPGLPLVPYNLRLRDGSYFGFNNTDLNGFAGFNEVFPILSWAMVDIDNARYKVNNVHVVYDAGGPADQTTGGGTSTIGAYMANTTEQFPLPTPLRVPGSRYCASADCPAGDTAGGSTGRVDAGWASSQAWQGLLGNNAFIEFAMRQFATGENGGIKGHVIYQSTRPFDDPQLLLQLSWEPGVANVRVNLYQKITDANGNDVLKLVDTTSTTSWDDWAQGFRRNADNSLVTVTDGTGTRYVPNMNCPGQDNTSPFYFTMRNITFPLDPANHPLAFEGRYKCYDGWSMLSQVQPAPYNGMYKFPSIVAKPGATRTLPTDDSWTVQPDPTTFKTNCTICGTGPDGTPMLPPGKYVVEVVVPPGYELVKEEDKNILLGDAVVAALPPQFPEGFGAIFIMPDQAAVNGAYNPRNTLQRTANNGAVPRREGDTGSVEVFWPCVGEKRIVPDLNSLYPGAQQQAPFAGATRPLCDRKEITLSDQMTALAKFYVFSSAHIAGHFRGTITNDFAAEFDPFSPQFGEKFAPANLPVGIRDPSGREVSRVYGDQWGIYNGLTYSTWTVFPPSPSGYTPTMMIMCMNDPGPIPDPAHPGQLITDPNYNPAYSNFCYEIPYMPGTTFYPDTPVIPTMAFAAGYNLPDCEYPDTTPAIKSVVNTNAETRSGVTLAAGRGPWVANSGGSHRLTVTALGDKKVLNHAYSGPNAPTAPFNAKFITRHFGFGACPSPNGSSSTCRVTIAGVRATVNSWTDTTIVVTVPEIPETLNTSTGVGSTCRSGNGNNANTPGPGQTPRQRSATGSQNEDYRCGQLVITAASGRKSIDTVTVTVAGKPPTVVTPSSPSVSTFGHIQPNPLQTAIDQATPGDLIIVRPGEYRENLLMWKPVRLQGVGAESVTINADAHPAGKLDSWRRQVNCLFGLSLEGRPLLAAAASDATPPGYDPTGLYSCPARMRQRVDRISREAIIGWDTTGNGNLAQMLQEPTLMGAYEGAGITVLGRGIRIPANSSDFFGSTAEAGFPAGYEYLTNTNPPGPVPDDCAASTTRTDGRDYGTSNYLCNPSRIDGVSVINSSQGGGAIWAHGWNHFLEVSNTRIRANHGTLTGGIAIGAGEFPDPFIVGGDLPPPPGLPVTAAESLLVGLQVGYGLDRDTKVHHNMVTGNSSVGDSLYSKTNSAAGGVVFCTGADGYVMDHNWVCGNLSSGDAGGVAHSGFINNGTIKNNWIIFNQSQNPTIPTNGGGLGVLGASPDRTLPDGTECGNTNDLDCPPGLPEGTGRNLLIDGNLLMGNSAESGTGGGLRLQMVNGLDVPAFPLLPLLWNDVTVQNNIIADNVAGWDGGGVSMQDALRVRVINNTIVSNDTTASAGVLFNTLGAPKAAVPPPGCTPQPDPTLPQDPSCINPVPTSTNQASGLVTMRNTPNMNAALAPIASVLCPLGYGYGALLNGDCRSVSLPLLLNNVLWQNRAFHVEVGPVGSGNQNQQAVATLVPSLNQTTTTGQCVATGTDTGAPGSGGPVNYWDIGVRGDTGPTNHGSGFTLVPQFSILSSGNYSGNGNSTANPQVISQYCNGAKIPPERCATAGADPFDQLRCRGYNAPPGRSEATGTYPVFALIQTVVAPTTDEGNNWINLLYGPLSLTNPSLYTGAGQTPPIPLLGDYSLQSTSPAINAIPLISAGGLAAPNHDFFGNPRKTAGTGAVDKGAVEFQGTAGGAGFGIAGFGAPRRD